jgi:hypothetical protein
LQAEKLAWISKAIPAMALLQWNRDKPERIDARPLGKDASAPSEATGVSNGMQKPCLKRQKTVG